MALFIIWLLSWATMLQSLMTFFSIYQQKRRNCLVNKLKQSWKIFSSQVISIVLHNHLHSLDQFSTSQCTTHHSPIHHSVI